jgi:hypothetical protein
MQKLAIIYMKDTHVMGNGGNNGSWFLLFRSFNILYDYSRFYYVGMLLFINWKLN